MVYGPQNENEKMEFLQELKEIKELVGQRWLIIGDFNMIMHAEDKSSSILNQRVMGAFREAVNAMLLKEIKLIGRKYAWSNSRTHTCIDRAFCTVDWEVMLPSCELRAESSASSDHSPLLLVGDVTRRLYKGFKFECFWPQLPGYLDVVSESWNQPTGVHNAYLNLHIKLQRTAKRLKQWARTKIGTNKMLMVAARKLIQVLDIAQATQ